MNRKQLIFLVVALVIIGGASLLLINHHQESWNESDSLAGGKLLKNFQVNDVSTIHIQGETNLDLVRKEDGWHVEQRDGYPANISQIRDLLLKLNDIKIVQSEPVDSDQLGELHLEQPGKGADGAVLLEFKNSQGGTMDSLLLGKKHTEKPARPSPMPYGDEGYADGRYVMLTADPKDVLTISDPLNDASPKPAEWLNKDFFKVEKPESISFVSTNATNSWTITRAGESSPWMLSDVKPGELVDTNKLTPLASTLSWPSFVDVAPGSSKTAMENPLEVVIKTFDHFTYRLKIGKKTSQNNYDINVNVTANLPPAAPPAKGKQTKETPDTNKTLEAKLAQEKALAPWTYEVSSWLIDPLIRNRGQLMVEKKDEKKTARAASSTPESEPVTAPENPTDAIPASQ